MPIIMTRCVLYMRDRHALDATAAQLNSEKMRAVAMYDELQASDFIDMASMHLSVEIASMCASCHT